MRKLLVAWLALAPMTAAASTFDTYGFGSRALSMGGAMTADANDFTATFYNPSLLAFHTKINLGFGLFYEKPEPTVTAANSPNPSFDSSVQMPPDAASYTAGFIFPFAGKLQDRVSLGIGISLPSQNLVKVAAIEPSQPTWYLYQSDPDRIQLFAGLGIRPLDWLAIGIGIQALANFAGNITFNIDLFNKTFTQRSLTNELTNKLGAVAGLTVIPLPNLSFGFTFRQSMELDYELPTNLQLGDIGSLFLDVKGVTFYTPNEFNFGVHYSPIPGLTLDGDLDYARWSVAPNPSAQIKVRFSGDLATGLGLDQALALDSQDAALGFQDIVIPRFGLEWNVVDALSLRCGYYFRPTFIPEQNGLTNVLDGPTHVISAGLGFRFMSPMETMVDPIEIDAVFQHGFIGQREADKTGNNPVASYSYSAQTEVFAIDLRYNFDIVRPSPHEDPPVEKDEKATDEAKPKPSTDQAKPAAKPKTKTDEAKPKKSKPKSDDDDLSS